MISILLTMNKHQHNLIKLELYNNWSALAVNNISDSAMWHLSKPMKFAHLWKLANQSTLNKPHVIGIQKACAVALIVNMLDDEN